MQSTDTIQMTHGGPCNINDKNTRHDFLFHGKRYSSCLQVLLDMTQYQVHGQQIYLIEGIKSDNISPSLVDASESHEIIVSIPAMKEFSSDGLITHIEQVDGSLFRIKTRWSHPLSTIQKHNVYMWDATTGHSNEVSSESTPIHAGLVK
jgi:hypothetical protein